MTLFNVSEQKETALMERMKKLGVTEDDLNETFIRGTGSGGQKINKTSSTVFLIHKPTGLSVKCQQGRSQSLNRFMARRLLLDRIERVRKGAVDAEKRRIEKLRRQKRKRSKRAKEKVLQMKHQQSEKKTQRSKGAIPPADE